MTPYSENMGKIYNNSPNATRDAGTGRKTERYWISGKKYKLLGMSTTFCRGYELWVYKNIVILYKLKPVRVHNISRSQQML